MSGWEIPVLAITTGAGAGLGISQQRTASKNARRAAASTQAAAQTSLDQSGQAAALERAKIRRLRRRVEGRLAVTAADAGVGTGETFDLLMSELGTDAAINERVVDLNLAAERDRLESGVISAVQRLEASVPNAALSLLGGALGGFQTGLSFIQAGDLLDDVGNPGAAPTTLDDLGVPERPEF